MFFLFYTFVYYIGQEKHHSLAKVSLFSICKIKEQGEKTLVGKNNNQMIKNCSTEAKNRHVRFGEGHNSMCAFIATP